MTRISRNNAQKPSVSS